MPKQATYLVECSLPVPTEAHRRAMRRAVQQASKRLTAAGSTVIYLGTLFVPARSRCFSLFEAASIDAVRAVNEAALVPYIAINEAIREAIDLRAVALASEAEPHNDGQRSASRRETSR
ncbi:MAG TPA: hypothetical protein VFL29_01980 [Candidatus Dormibacteraeota bacterium]|nr:hypothetical protein [Candidatus Dormibacteraeota bacterium]